MAISSERPVLLSLAGIGVNAGKRPLLRGIDLDVRAGELVALTGPSGLGKTTLLRAVACLDDPVEGNVRFEGRSPMEHGIPVYRRRVVYVAQRPLLLDASVEENLARPFRYKAAAAPYPAGRAADLLDRLLVTRDRLSQKALSLSEGQRQRVCLLRALLVDPAVLLLDEPLSALDAASSDAVMSCLRAWVSEAPRTVVLVLHHAERAAACDRSEALEKYACAVAPEPAGATSGARERRGDDGPR